MTAAAVVAVPSLAPPPEPAPPVASHAIELTVSTRPLWPTRLPDTNLNRVDVSERAVVSSLAAPIPAPPAPGPAPAATNINQAIKNIYNAAEPWVRYGFELAGYAVGWVPYVGWLSGQVMIFYNFGERIVRSITFNLDDWIFGPLPFGEGLANVARDSWDALVQLGVDQWNFWLPPLPPLPLVSEASPAPSEDADLTTVLQQRGQTAHAETPVVDASVSAEKSTDAEPVVTQAEPDEQVEEVDGGVVTDIAPVSTEPAATDDLDEAEPEKRPSGGKSPQRRVDRSADADAEPDEDTASSPTKKPKADSSSTESASTPATSVRKDAGERPRSRSVED
ncbi:hypothetical protein BH10ACT9_BH10ACT9_32150 [soil metagenome]